jgi:SAM-dependent methyltransferase/uncharacterized protein YbaR (Trm112 family)
VRIADLDVLACPACQGRLRLACFEGDPQDCREGLLSCEACEGWYPLTAGIPRLLLPGPLRQHDAGFIARHRALLPAEIAPPAGTTSAPAEGQAQVQRAFAHKWTRQAWWGMEGESARFMEEWLLSRYGFGDAAGLRGFLEGRSLALDAGCGLGREALRMAAARHECRVFGLELSDCVDEAARHARERGGGGNVTFVQGDLMTPPFANGRFDYVVSEGVLHHTPDTRLALLALVPLLAPGAQIGFYVYRRKAPVREFVDDHVRARLSGMGPDEAWRAMEPLTELGRALAELHATVELPRGVDVLGIPAGRHDLQRLVYYHLFKCFWNDRLSFDENVHVNFDWYYPRYAWRHHEDEIRTWIREAGLATVHEHVEPSGITVRAARPR